ncbi:hypothetical protein IJ103_04270 [Candidatus Saccharibacteria bacterium]|nr:hypothetical protein [Candidatus Saccharibacteria bacterium]
MRKQGKLVDNGVTLKPHENLTVDFLLKLGHNIELIPKLNIEGVHTPDVKMDGKYDWEMKSPRGKGRWLMNNTIRNAKKQSENIIIDLRRAKLNQGQCIKDLQILFMKTKSIKRMIIITKSKNILTWEKK